MISRKENAALAIHLFRQALERYDIQSEQLIVHQDRGAPMIADGYRDFLDKYGVRRSFSRPRVSNDNPYSESFFKTVKFFASYPRRFDGIEHARAWMRAFIEVYKMRPHEGLAFYTPFDVFHGHVDEVIGARAARAGHVLERPPVALPAWSADGCPSTEADDHQSGR